MTDTGEPAAPENTPSSTTVEFTGSALEFLQKQADDQNVSIEDVVSSAVGTYAYLKDQARNGSTTVLVDKGGKRSKIDI